MFNCVFLFLSLLDILYIYKSNTATPKVTRSDLRIHYVIVFIQRSSAIFVSITMFFSVALPWSW